MIDSPPLTEEDLAYIDEFFTRENFLKLVWALGFYADHETYFAIGFLGDRPCGEFMDDFSTIQYINPETGDVVESRYLPGEHARSTIAEVFNADRDAYPSE